MTKQATAGKVLKPGDRIELTIDGVAFGGDGVGRYEGQVIFVPFTVDGDAVAVRITQTGKRFARARMEDLLQPSPYRIDPHCRYHGCCGGCCYQHIRYDHQLQLKQRQVADAFKRIAKLKHPPIDPIVGSPGFFNYRAKADYHVHVSRKGSLLIGFMDVAGERVIDIERCEIVDESINEACRDLRRDLASGAMVSATERQTIWSADRSGEKAIIAKDLHASRFVTRTVKGKRLSVPSGGFFQANRLLLPRLVDDIVEACALNGRETVLDLHCGSGLFSLFLAPASRLIYGIEINEDAVRCARENFKQTGLDHAVFLQGEAGEVLQKQFVEAGRHVDVLVLDPPRTGCDAILLSAVAALKPDRLVYVSCNPATQARDIRHLLDRGFTLTKLKPYDMFPQTAHIEAVALMRASTTAEVRGCIAAQESDKQRAALLNTGRSP
jgi:tRNA/tmRNA/rRNA uracil-C5-methylase (TrmA/RlmC/RlmD family)